MRCTDPLRGVACPRAGNWGSAGDASGRAPTRDRGIAPSNSETRGTALAALPRGGRNSSAARPQRPAWMPGGKAQNTTGWQGQTRSPRLPRRLFNLRSHEGGSSPTHPAFRKTTPEFAASIDVDSGRTIRSRGGPMVVTLGGIHTYPTSIEYRRSAGRVKIIPQTCGAGFGGLRPVGRWSRRVP